jgi:Aspartyl/Asparaginyl beta-hydroxylase
MHFYQNKAMIKYLKLPFTFDAGRMQEEVNKINAINWQLHYQKLHYEGNWSALPLRSVGGKADDIIISPLENPVYADTVFIQDANYLKEVLGHFKCTLLSVRLMKLESGALIKEHRDEGLNFEKKTVRFHIPIITHEKVEFILDKEPMALKEGECWYMNFNLPHSLHNRSMIDRIHLVIDAEVNNWVKGLFRDKNIVMKKEINDPPIYSVEERKNIIKSLRIMNTEISIQLADRIEKESQNP